MGYVPNGSTPQDSIDKYTELAMEDGYDIAYSIEDVASVAIHVVSHGTYIYKITINHLPTTPVVTAVAENGEATLSWDAIDGAEKYAVFYYKNGKYYSQTMTCTETSYTIPNLTNGVEYEFLVQAYVNGKWSTFTTADHVSVTPEA